MSHAGVDSAMLHGRRAAGATDSCRNSLPCAKGDSPIFVSRKSGQSPGQSVARRRAAGITLVELLVVVGILMLLAAVAIPSMRPALEGRRVREAARMANVYIASARIRAVELGRPCGVILQRFEGQPECAMVLHQAEVPPPYAGDVLDAVVRVQDWTLDAPSISHAADGSVVLKLQLRFPVEWSNNLIRRGDLIQLNHQGPYYTIDDDPADNDPPAVDLDFPVDSDGDIDFSVGTDTQPPSSPDGWIDSHWLTLKLEPGQLQSVPWPDILAGWSPPVPFEIFRGPRKSSAAPLQLPARTVIDLAASGFDAPFPPPGNLGAKEEADHNPNNSSFAPFEVAPSTQLTDPVIIMFSPNGSLDEVYCGYYEWDAIGGAPLYQYGQWTVVDPIYLLVGKRERVEAPAAPNQFLDVLDAKTQVGLDEDQNWESPDSLWITIRPQSGMVSVAENYVDDRDDPNHLPSSIPQDKHWWDWFHHARTFAREAESLGGR